VILLTLTFGSFRRREVLSVRFISFVGGPSPIADCVKYNSYIGRLGTLAPTEYLYHVLHITII